MDSKIDCTNLNKKSIWEQPQLDVNDNSDCGKLSYLLLLLLILSVSVCYLPNKKKKFFLVLKIPIIMCFI